MFICEKSIRNFAIYKYLVFIKIKILNYIQSVRKARKDKGDRIEDDAKILQERQQERTQGDDP